MPAINGKQPSAIPDSLLNPCLRSDIQFKNLPAEIIFRILSYLDPNDLVQSASCCREWYYIASDPLLWRVLDLSTLRSKSFNPKTATSLTSRLRTCREFILDNPPDLTHQHVTALLHFLSSSPMLNSLTLQKLGHLLNSHSLEHHFRFSQSRCLTNVNLNNSNVTTPAVVAMMNKHKNTLKTLDLSYTAIGDGTLRSVSQAQVLHTLDISNCPSISRTSIRNFLTKRFPSCLVNLSLRNMKEVKITWLYDLLRLPSSANLKVLNVEGCERLTLGDLKELQEAFSERLEIKHNAREVVEDNIWGYRRYIDFLGEEPNLPERLTASGAASANPPNAPAPPSADADLQAQLEIARQRLKELEEKVQGGSSSSSKGKEKEKERSRTSGHSAAVKC
ncbi:hypothetical protein EDC01DRAFT_636854 [Geopyxis carbonaria]|nr:hypothetical protein EDC01DRAFT_636854 [Geopyxis carbonaria]